MYFDIVHGDTTKRIDILHGLPDDWEDAMALCWRVFRLCDAKDYPAHSCDSFLNFITDQYLKKMFLLGRYRLYVAKDGEEIVGVLGFREKNHISLLFVDTAYQGCGIGRALIAALVSYLEGENRPEYLPDNEADKILDALYEKNTEPLITVNSAPSAVTFYQTAGFVQTHEQLEKDGIVYVPMEIRLRPAATADIKKAYDT